MNTTPPIHIKRIQTGVRMDQRLLAVLSTLADGAGLGHLIEEMVLHAFAGAVAFSPDALARIRKVKSERGMDFDFPDRAAGQAHDSGKREQPVQPERIQAGFQIETRLLKVLKALAEREDMGLGELLEDIAYHQLAGADAFTKKTLLAIALLEQVYGIEYGVHDNARFVDG